MSDNASSDENRVRSLIAVTNQSPNEAIVEIWADPTTHRLLVNAIVTSGSIGTSLIASALVGQKASHASTPQQLSASSTPATNGILVQALAANTAQVYIGGVSVSSADGFELQPGQAVPFTVDNITDLYVVGGSGTDKVCWNVL